MRRWLAATVAIVGLGLAQTPAAEPAGEIAGRVVCAQTGAPLRNALVSLRLNESDGRSPRSTVTAADGRFILAKVPAGSYTVEVEKAGYRRREQEPLSLSVATGGRRADLEIKLWRAGAMSGRVLDWDGEPLVLARVRAHAVRHQNGRPELVPREEVLTDDRGEYRIPGLPGDRYIVSAWPPHPGAPTYYPAAPSPSEAQRLGLRWGQELTSIDLKIPNWPAFTVTGRVGNGIKEAPCGNCEVEAYRLGNPFRLSLAATGSVSPSGDFVILGLAPGSYRIVAMLRGYRTLAASRPVEITDRGLEGLNLIVGPGEAVSGEIIFQDPPADLKTERTVVTAYGNGLPAYWPMGGAVLKGNERSFEMEDLPPETYRFEVAPLPAGGYLKSLRVLRRDLPGPELTVDEGVPLSGVEAVVAFDGATVTGKVKGRDAGSEGSQIVDARLALIPQPGQSPYLTEREAFTDAAGNFSLEGVPPGAYVVYAVARRATADLLDPETQAALQAFGANVKLEPRSKLSIEPVIALEPE